jgi:N-acetylglucosaminyldiphosphoundecaprenol N-acetyl-beta-D-mannosaminyltransferase
MTRPNIRRIGILRRSDPVSPGAHRVDVLGVGISTVTPETALEAMAGWIRRGDKHYVCVTGVHGVMESQRDPALLEIHNGSGLTVPDGMPMVWACQRAGAPWVTRVYGPDLMRLVCKEAPAAGWRMFFYGATQDVVDRLLAHLRATNPGLQVAGSICPPFRPLSEEEKRAIVTEINAARPDVVWVGLSTPKQERWMSENRPYLEAPVLVGVGAAFDFVSGSKRQAPPWLQRLGLEWLYRMLAEPRRLAKRYLKNNPAFAVRAIRRPPHLRAADAPAAAPSAPPAATASHR